METTPVKVKWKKRIFRLLLVLIALITIPLLISVLYHRDQVKQFDRSHKPVGQMVDVGGYRLHYYAVGEGKGLPTVLLESGSGTPSSYADWRYVQPELASFTRVITYDRAGYGWSEEAGNDRTSRQIAQELHRLLDLAGESGPYILAGHSFGGLSVQQFADQYPDEVAGIVLLDSSIAGSSPDVSPSQLSMTKLLRQSGMMRAMGKWGMLPVPKAVLSDELSAHFLYKRFYNEDQISEIEQMGKEAFPRISLGDVPVTVISAREEEQANPLWQTQQDEYLKVSTNSKRLIAENSSHYIHHDQPELVIDALKDMLFGLREENGNRTSKL